jgi:hypothetical protein
MPSHQSSFIAVIALIVHGLFIGPTPTVLGQGREQNKTQSEAGRKVPAFKGSGLVRRLPKGPPPPPPPPALSVGLITKLIGGEPGSLYAKLTPSQPIATNRGALVFVNADLVEGGEGYAQWHSLASGVTPLESYLALWLNSSAGRKYLIDCAVRSGISLKGVIPGAEHKPTPFKVIGPDGSSQTFQLPDNEGHLIFTLGATKAGWYGFQIIGGGLTWTFYSCEVTNL